MMNSFLWPSDVTLWYSIWWSCFVKHGHGGASPWAEAAGGASRWTWNGATLGRVFGIKGLAPALRLRNRVLGATRGPRGRLALCLRGARGAQSSVAYWAGATVRNGVGWVSWGRALASVARWGQRRSAAEARCQLFDRVLVVLVSGWVEGRCFVRREDAIA